ncbi:MAG TPA: biotin--[acetyl-CoA-carboxylase] ligase [Gordonibacter urolithinfaciens]|uniref:biotin--[acetyl-CoA-carboxylase] ligase n=1 Tax=Gordonibacter urolithinfaciens TaxID=1335613 RepID=UPI001D246398|nr:biotin--[acetyl-CoA-carboxylase] ligase [Gordonibacter urolithinfaciens]HJF63125.1 biotin--[acetyl-CoA-carboxylase] ligase [Gordonibacter urolithinfaciens]
MSEPLAFRLRVLDEVTSTNDEVKRALEAGEPEGLALRARRQTGGYGRQGRAWASPEGGLYLSLLLRPSVDAALLPTLSLVTALAVRRAVAGLLPAEAAESVKVKWPNDLVVPAACRLPDPAFRKLCGISLEAHAGGVCVGIGVNVELPDPADNVAVDGKNVPVYLPELGFEGGIDDVAVAVLHAYAPLYHAWQTKGFAPLAGEYAAHASLTGRSVRMVNLAGEPVAEGTVASVDAFGRLVLRAPDGSCVPVASGEAHLV